MKKFISLLLALLLSISCLSGCVNILLPEYTPSIDLAEPFIGFRAESKRGVDLETYTRVDLADLETYESPLASYGASYYYDTLQPQEQTLYRIVQYAMDHAMRCLFIDERVLPNIEEEVDLILHCLALDHPLLEQNLYWSHGMATVEFPNPNPFSKAPGQSVTGVILDISEFSPEKWAKKEQAIQKAEEILQDLPADGTDREKAEHIYRYLGNNVEYFVAEDRGPERDYLYDALLEGKTLCDGFSNAFSLLCNMAGIPCVEKMHTQKEDEADRSGHTWNAVQLGGIWYNVDATGAKEVKEKHPRLVHFGFADEMLEHSVDYEDRAPKCEDYLQPPDVIITKSGKAGSMVKDAWKTVKKTGRAYVIARFPDGKQTDSVMQKIANSLGKGFSYYLETTQTGEAIYYIFPK